MKPRFWESARAELSKLMPSLIVSLVIGGGALSLLAGCSGGSGGGGGDNAGGDNSGGGSTRYRLIAIAPGSLLDRNTSPNAIDSSGSQIAGSHHDGTVNSDQALLWTGIGTTTVELGPGVVRDVDGGVQIGHSGVEGLSSNARLWRGTAASAVNLHPAGFTQSLAAGGTATQQAGFGQLGSGTRNALLWRGTAESVVNLHPAGFSTSRAYDTTDGAQVGSGRRAGIDMALLWRGSAGSVVELQPAGFNSSVAWAVSDDMQVGQGFANGASGAHALLWRGTAASAVDLHPQGFDDSRAFGVLGNRQVGYGVHTASGKYHALVWSGTASSYVDLHQFTTSYVINGANPVASFASGVDSLGRVVGYVQTADRRDFAVVWEPIP